MSMTRSLYLRPAPGTMFYTKKGKTKKKQEEEWETAKQAPTAYKKQNERTTGKCAAPAGHGTVSHITLGDKITHPLWTIFPGWFSRRVISKAIIFFVYHSVRNIKTSWSLDFRPDQCMCPPSPGLEIMGFLYIYFCGKSPFGLLRWTSNKFKQSLAFWPIPCTTTCGNIGSV